MEQKDQIRKVTRRLRRKDTHEYFKADGWTTKPEEAAVFDNCMEAAQTCAQYKLTDVELAVHVEEQEVFSTEMR